ncbi:MAG: DJ-1/PfpI family protein, partial [Spirochaetia bacterium]
IIVEDKRFVQTSSRIMTSGGISAGIDLSLHMIEKLVDLETRVAVVSEMEYNEVGSTWRRA